MCVCDYVGGGGILCVCVCEGFCVCYYVGGWGWVGILCMCTYMHVGCLLLSEEFSAPLSCTCLGQS